MPSGYVLSIACFPAMRPMAAPGAVDAVGRTGVPRLFVGLELPESLKGAVAELQVGFRDARWLDPDGLHLTLAFIGEVDHSAQHRIEGALSRVEASAFAVGLHGVGHFPHRGPPRVLWTAASPGEELGRLAASVRRVLARAGHPPERRKFTPHVTIARFRRPPPPQVIADYQGAYSLFRTPAVPVASFRLFSSVLRPSGARYAVEAEFPLAEKPAPE